MTLGGQVRRAPRLMPWSPSTGGRLGQGSECLDSDAVSRGAPWKTVCQASSGQTPHRLMIDALAREAERSELRQRVRR
jgi:hypothetical protein